MSVIAKRYHKSNLPEAGKNPRSKIQIQGEITMTVADIKETALYLTFHLEDEVFSIDVSQVREVLDMSNITKVPRAPEFMRGVINVRGSVVPVVDLRAKFGLPMTEATVDTRIIILETKVGDKATVLGAVADSVNDVVELDPKQIEETPSLGDRWRSEFIKGIGKKDDEFIILLDMNLVFSTDDLIMVEDAKAVQKTDETEEGAETQASIATDEPHHEDIEANPAG